MKLSKVFIVIFLISLFIFPMPKVFAASFNMTSSVSSISPGGSFTIRVGGNCIGRVNLSSSNATLSNKSVWVEEGYVTVRVKAGKSGKVVVTATPQTGFSDSNANTYNPGSRRIVVTIKTNNNKNTSSSSSSSSNSSSNVEVKSSDNNLSMLKISEGELSPKFDKSKTNYKVSLKADTTSVTIDAKSSSSKAKLNYSKKVSLNAGDNPVKIIVTAENRAKKTYTINFYVDETPRVYLDYHNDKIGLLRNAKKISAPKEFKLSNYNINNSSIPIYTKEKLNLVYGKNTNNEKSFYLINKENNKLISKITPLTIKDHNLYLTDKKPDSTILSSNKITINKQEVDCYKIKDYNENYCLLITYNDDETLTKYLYEKQEGTIQLYYEREINTNITNKIIYSLIGLLLVAISIIIILILKLKKGEKYEKI